MTNSFLDKLKKGMGESMSAKEHISDAPKKDIKKSATAELKIQQKHLMQTKRSIEEKTKSSPTKTKLLIKSEPLNNKNNNKKSKGEETSSPLPRKSSASEAQRGRGTLRVPRPRFANACVKEKWFGQARQSFAEQNLGGQEGQLTVDIYQTETKLIIQSAVAGIKPEDLDITIERDLIIIKGIREEPLGYPKEKKDYFVQECYWGPFSRKIVLPVEINPDRAQASMKQGVLVIQLPKTLREKKRKIKIKE